MDHLLSLSPEQIVYMSGGIVFLGAFAGFLAGLLGVGGGIVLVPGLFFLFGFLDFHSPYLMHMAVGTSLAIIIPTGYSSARAHWKKGGVDVRLLKLLGPGIVVGVVFGTLLASILSGESLKLVFACAVMVFAVMMVANPGKLKLMKEMPGRIGSSAAGVVVGTLSTLIGIGGATLNVPFMTMAQVPVHRAIGTASALGLFIAVPAAFGFFLIGQGGDRTGLPPFSFGFVNVLAWAAIVPVSVMVAPLGAYIAHSVSVVVLRRVFAVFMVIVAIKMGLEVL